MESTTTVPKHTTKAFLQRALKKLSVLIQNVICLLIWTWLVFRIWQHPFPLQDLISSLQYIVEIATVRLVLQIVAVIIVLAIFIFRKLKPGLRFLFFFWARLLFFPFVAVFHLIVIPLRSTRFVYKIINAFLNRFVRTTITKAAVLLVVFLPASVIIVLQTQDPSWLAIWILLVILSLLITLRTAFYWTAKPLVIIDVIVQLLVKAATWTTNFMLRSANKSTTDPTKQVENTRRNLALLHQALDWLQNFSVRTTNNRIILRFFFLLFIVCFSITVFAFGVLYFALGKMNTAAFANISGEGLWEYVYRSLSVITTSGELTAVWSWAKAAISAEILCGISLLTMLIFQRSMISIPEVLEARQNVLESLAALRSDFDAIERPFLEVAPINQQDKPPELGNIQSS